MTLEIKCYKCNQELKEPGALLFGPPDNIGLVKKYHLCRKCYIDFEKLME
jgi:hypothetical protein